MDYINRVPVILALVAAIVTGLISNHFEVDNKQIIGRMIIAIIVFLSIGFYLKYILHSVLEEQKLKKQKQEEDEQAAALKEQEAANTEDMSKGKIDYRVDSDEFTPLDLSKAIKSVIK